MNWLLVANIIITTLFVVSVTLNAKQLVKSIGKKDHGWSVYYSFTTILFAYLLII